MQMQRTFVIACISLALLAEAKEFLRGGGVSKMEDVLDTLLADSVLQNGVEKTKSRLDEVQAFLQPTFKALPKATDHGPYVTPKVARYALHRYFEHRHDQFLRGLGPAGQSYDNSMQEQSATATLHQYLEEAGEGPNGGVSLRSLAAVAIALEDVILDDNLDLIRQAYTTINLFRDLEIDPDLEIDRSNLDRLVVDYMMIYISGADKFDVTEQGLQEYRDFMVNGSRNWMDTEEWIRTTYVKVMSDLGYSDGVLSKFHLRHVQRIVEDMLVLYDGFNDRECEKVKARLLTMDDRHTGRVSLADFYREGLSGTWAFNEKVEYLRDLGALDESKHGQPRVIVTNYVSSWVNCMTSPKHYAICCPNPCEKIMDKLERQIQAPTAIPSEIMFFAAQQDLQGSNRTLLEERLGHIAARHNGQVPLHGRLFAQWLHHAAPLECPYPHETGTINPQAPNEWMEEKGLSDLKATKEEMMKYISVGANGNIGGQEVHSEDQAKNDVPWSDVEELMIVRKVEPRASHLRAGASASSDYSPLLFELFAVCILIVATVRASKSRFYLMWLKGTGCSDKVLGYSNKVLDA